jgi:hypothetical protein
VWYNFDQYVYPEHEDPTRGMGVFGRFAYSTGKANPIQQFCSIGGKGVIPFNARLSEILECINRVFTRRTVIDYGFRITCNTFSAILIVNCTRLYIFQFRYEAADKMALGIKPLGLAEGVENPKVRRCIRAG